jgi:transketolase
MTHRPDPQSLIGQDTSVVPMALQRILKASSKADTLWIGPAEGKKLSAEEQKAHDLAHKIMCHLVIQAPTKHASGHPGGALSSFTFAYFLSKRRDPSVDQPLRISPGHLSLLSYGLQWMFGREGKDERLQSPQTIIDTFRTPGGLPGHVEAGIGDIPFGTGPLGKGASHAVGTAFGLKHQKKPGIVDVLLADGDAQEGQVFEAFRLATHLQLDNLVVHGDWNDIQLSDMPSRTVAADFAAMAQAAGWQVIEVQDGNDPAQVEAALDAADGCIGKGRPIFVCYYTTMGHGVPVMVDGSNTGKENFHGSPLKKDIAEKALQDLPALEDLMKEYAPFRAAEQKRYKASVPVETNIPLSWNVKALEERGYMRAVTAEKGAARKDFGATHLKAIMKLDPRIVVLHADLAASGGFDKVQKEFPDRVVNVGVAEGNMYMMAAGMRQTGLLPVTYTFAAFGTNEARASARLIDVNCGHTRCGVIHDCTHAGLSVGEDGETHQERNYLNIPLDHTQVWMPGDSNQAAAAAEKALEIIAEGHKSVYIFSPRSDHPQLLTPAGEPIYGPQYQFDCKMDLIRGTGGPEDQLTIFATGIAIHDAVAAADRLWSEEKIRARVLNVGCIRPLDAASVIQAALETVHLIVAEDHHSEGGLASQIADVVADFQLLCSLRRLGVNHYFPSGNAEDLKFLAGLDTDSIINAALDEMKSEVVGGEDVLVTIVYALADTTRWSRFRDAAAPFIDRLLEEKGYLEKLRDKWVKRSIPSDRLPSSEQLRARFGR